MDYFHEHIEVEKKLPAQVVIHCPEGYYGVPKHWHRSLELDLMIHAKAEVYQNGVTNNVEDGFLLVANSGDIHSIKALTLEYLDAISLIISYDFLKDIFPDMDKVVFDVPQDHAATLEIKKAMYELWQLHKDVSDEFIYLKSNETIFHVLYLLFRNFRQERRLMVTARTEKYIDRFK